MSKTSPPTQPLDSQGNSSRRRQRRSRSLAMRRKVKVQLRQWLSPAYRGHGLAVAIALFAAVVTIKNPAIVQLMERNLQTAFFDFRGRVEPPGNKAGEPGVVILAMDGETMTQGSQIYPTDPKRYAYFETIQQWPWQRTAYAIAIDRLMQAGAKAVVIDVVLDALGTYGTEDDQRLQQVLKKYSGRITLAAQYEDEEKRTGYETKLLTPNSIFQAASPNLGFIDFPISPNGRIHELGSEYLRRIEQSHEDIGVSIAKVPSFAEAALQSAGISPPPTTGTDIFFYGPSRTFDHIPFWHVLDPQNWNDFHLRNQTFKNKIVLIGPTNGGEAFQDFHLAPFSGSLRYPEEMAGVEIQANAIATLMQGKAIATLVPNPLLQGLFVAILVLAASYLQSRNQRLLRRFAYGFAIALAWLILSYAVFVSSRFTVPTAIPALAIILTSTTYLFTGIISDRNTVRKFVKRLVGTPDIESAVSDLNHREIQDVIKRHQQEFIGRKLKGRYTVLEQIGTGGFGETYKAIDTQRPNSPLCVVKRLRPANKSPKFMRLAESLFKREAEVLERLGKHDQIPQLLAYFEDQDEFYLAQEYVDGVSLADELRMYKLLRPISEQKVVLILYELLEILEFVHQQGVIHRDIKPANVIRRRLDKKLVLIDFGAVKQVAALEEQSDGTVLTVAIGTQGYTAPEQLMGKPCPSSDIYSLGMTGIRSLTGIEPRELESARIGTTAEFDWKTSVQISHALTAILDKMVRVDVSDRYRTVQAVMTDLEPLVKYAQNSDSSVDFWESSLEPNTNLEEASATDETKPWMSDIPHIKQPDPDSTEATEEDLENTKSWGEYTVELPPTDADENSDTK